MMSIEEMQAEKQVKEQERQQALTCCPVDIEKIERITQRIDDLDYFMAEAQRLPMTLQDYKTAQLAKINTAFAAEEAHGSIISSIGFPVDATERANRDTEGLITVLSATGENATMFCDHNNAMRSVTLEQLKSIRLEIIGHGQALYAKKWLLREAITTAETVDDVLAVEWKNP